MSKRDNHMRQVINPGESSYHPNTVSNDCPMHVKQNMGGFVSYAEKMNGGKMRGKSAKFFDHFSQAALFFNSQSDAEQQHIVDALTRPLHSARNWLYIFTTSLME